jgi:hypothetical protein
VPRDALRGAREPLSRRGHGAPESGRS